MDNSVSSTLSFQLFKNISYYKLRLTSNNLWKRPDLMNGIKIVPSVINEYGHFLRQPYVNSTDHFDSIRFEHNLEKPKGYYFAQSFLLRQVYNFEVSAVFELEQDGKALTIETDSTTIRLETPRSKRCYECNGGSMFNAKNGPCPANKEVTCYQGKEFACMRFERIENNMHKIIQSCKKRDACEIQKRNFAHQRDCSNGQNCIQVSCCYGDYCNALENSPTYVEMLEKEKQKQRLQQLAPRSSIRTAGGYGQGRWNQNKKFWGRG